MKPVKIQNHHPLRNGYAGLQAEPINLVVHGRIAGCRAGVIRHLKVGVAGWANFGQNRLVLF